MEQNATVRKTFSKWRVLIPIVLGLSVATWMLWRATSEVKFVQAEKGEYRWTDTNRNGIVDFSRAEEFLPDPNGDYNQITFRQGWNAMEWSGFTVFCLAMALAMMGVRDLAYMWRIRILTDKELSWKQSFRVIMVWEFASAMTPGVVGGAAVAMFILNRENINMGRATALVLITALLDELFYILIVPLLVVFIGTAALFPIDLTRNLFGMDFGIVQLFWIAFSIIALITLLLFIGIFIAPAGFRSLLLLFCKLPFLRRLKERAQKTGDDIVIASAELRGKPFSYWGKAFLATSLSWTGRFLVINFILMAFAPMADQLVIFARQLSMWVLLMVSPTPGGSGVAELAFSGFLEEFVPFGMAGILAVLWRLISYFPYLFIGALVIPGWLEDTGNKTDEKPKPGPYSKTK